MLIGKVVGSVVATRKDEKIEGRKLLVGQVPDSGQADEVVPAPDVPLGRRHRRDRDERIELTVDRQQGGRHGAAQGPPVRPAGSPELVPDEHPLVLQRAVWARPEHQRIAVVPGLFGREPVRAGGRPPAQQPLDVRTVLGHDPAFGEDRDLEEPELEEALAFRAPRMPGLAAAGPARLGGVEGIYGIDELPLSWDANPALP